MFYSNPKVEFKIYVYLIENYTKNMLQNLWLMTTFLLLFFNISRHKERFYIFKPFYILI